MTFRGSPHVEPPADEVLGTSRIENSRRTRVFTIGWWRSNERSRATNFEGHLFKQASGSCICDREINGQTNTHNVERL